MSQDELLTLAHAYQEHDRTTRVHYLKIGVALALCFIPAGILLDYVLYLDHFSDLLYIRLTAIILILILFLGIKTSLKSHVIIAGILLALIINSATSAQIMLTDGAASVYYAGICAVLFAVGVLMPWRVTETTIVCIATLAIYLLSTYFNHHYYNQSLYDWPALYSNTFFLTLTIIICITGSHFHSKRRYNEFKLRYELNDQYNKLEDLDRTKSEFFSNVSHELRTPLTLILAPVQDMLNSGSCPEEDRRTLKIVQDNALRLLKLVNDLLEIVRLEEGKKELHKEILDFGHLLRGILSSISYLATQHGITINQNISHETILVSGDRAALEKIILNVLANAVKFSEPKSSINITTALDDDNSNVILTIEDQGIGISPKDLPFVFDRFKQVDSSNTRQHQGTGLGLALAKELTEKHDGKIHLNSTIGVGTTVTICLPVYSDTEIRPESGYRKENAINKLDETFKKAELTAFRSELDNSNYAAQHKNLGKPLLLVVDDEPDMLRYLISILRDDYELLTATNGKEALSLFLKHNPDIVLLDMMMPELDGTAVCKEVKKQSSSTKVILLTARMDEEAKLTALNQGADDFLTKPFSSVEVLTRLRNLQLTRQLQQNIAKQNEELKNTLSSLKQTQAKLVHSEKLNALGKLSAGLLHEINNPLNYSITAIQLAKSDPTVQRESDLQEYLEDIQEGMERIANIISDLRAFAYPSKLDLKTPFRLRGVIDKALHYTAAEIEDVNIKVECDGQVCVQGSPSHITQVLVNLISNAANALKNKEVGNKRISIFCHSKSDRVVVTVEDNGAGIGGDILTKIFDPFFTTKDVGEGMGLGLSICHTIIENHGGEINIRSNPSLGTQVSFDLLLENGDL